jgi:hypothetical protein
VSLTPETKKEPSTTLQKSLKLAKAGNRRWVELFMKKTGAKMLVPLSL